MTVKTEKGMNLATVQAEQYGSFMDYVEQDVAFLFDHGYWLPNAKLKELVALMIGVRTINARVLPMIDCRDWIVCCVQKRLSRTLGVPNNKKPNNNKTWPRAFAMYWFLVSVVVQWSDDTFAAIDQRMARHNMDMVSCGGAICKSFWKVAYHQAWHDQMLVIRASGEMQELIAEFTAVLWHAPPFAVFGPWAFDAPPLVSLPFGL